MKKTLLPLLLALLLLLSACGAQSAPAAKNESAAPDPLAEAAGEYTLFGVSCEGSLVEAEALDFRSVLTLDADGTGYLTINDEGGAVESWTLDGDRTVIHYGVSTIGGTIAAGVAVLDFGDDNILYYARGDADISGYRLLNSEEFVELLLKDALGDAELPAPAPEEGNEAAPEPEAEPAEESAAEPLLALEPVEYKLYALEYMGVCILNPELNITNEMTITLSADGSGSFISSGSPYELRWSNEEGKLSLIDSDGSEKSLNPEMLGDGVFKATIVMEDADFICYYFRAGADVSMIPAISATQALGQAPQS